MPEFLEATVDKFTFKVLTDRLYTADHLWVKAEGSLVKGTLVATKGDLLDQEKKLRKSHLVESVI